MAENPSAATADPGAQAESLRSLLRSDLATAFDEFLDGVPELQRERANMGPSSKQRNAYRDCGALLRSSAGRLAGNFRKAIASQLGPARDANDDAPPEFRFEDLTLQDPTDLDRSILVSRVVNRAERRFEGLLQEIAPRLDQWVYDRQAPFPVDGLTPGSICKAFRGALEELELDGDQLAAMLEMFENLFVPRLEKTYKLALDELKSYGLAGASAAARRESAAGTKPPPDAVPHQASASEVTVATGEMPVDEGAAARFVRATTPGTAAGDPGPARNDQSAGVHGAAGGPVPEQAGQGHATPSAAGDRPGAKPATGGAGTGMPAEAPQGGDAGGLDSQTLQMLEQVGRQKSAPAAYSDHQLAQDLNEIAHGRPAPGWSSANAADSLRRAQAIGRVFNELQADRHIASNLKPKFADMRFAVMKSALADARFFQDANHPLRRLLNELSRLAAASRMSSERGAANIKEMLADIHRQFEVAATEARPDQENHKPAEKEDIEKFIREQRQVNQKRRDELIRKSRELVQEELWLRTAQREIPDSGRRVCAYGWVPMMALKLLRKGAKSEAWNEGLRLLDRMVEGFDPSGKETVEMGPLFEDLRRNLQEVGMIENRIKQLLRELVQGLCEGGNRPAPDRRAAPSTPSEDELLARLLVKGEWFKLKLAGSDELRWLLSLRHDAATVQFESLDGEVLTLDRKQFVDDLKQGRSEPVDPSPAALRALGVLQGESPARPG